MMAVRAISVGLLLLSLPMAGCGTVTNLVGSRPEVEGKTPFGGVREDVWCIKAAANGEFGRTESKPEPELEQRPQVPLILLFAADLPLSIVGDFVMWPYTWAYTVINQPVPTPPVTLATGGTLPQTSP